MINVTKPFLPPLEEYQKYVAEIWERNWLTNNGPLVKELESKLGDYFGTEHFLFVSNGTIALQLAIKVLELKGEIITTPFSYVATTSSIIWEGCTPIYVDINSTTLNIDVELIEAAISERTTAILATHVFGNPCDIDAIDAIAKKYNLKVIYDAAHCFGTRYKGQSVLNYGDLSTISFHSTKLYHTIEGGGVVTSNAELKKKINYARNFGHDGPWRFNSVGINGKNSEFHAAMGLVNLGYVNHILEKREKDHNQYDAFLMELPIQKQKSLLKAEINYAYYPIIFESEGDCLAVFHSLKGDEIYARRYFYPALSQLGYIHSEKMTIAESISSRILCLPLYEELTHIEIEKVCRVIIKIFKNR